MNPTSRSTLPGPLLLPPPPSSSLSPSQQEEVSTRSSTSPPSINDDPLSKQDFPGRSSSTDNNSSLASNRIMPAGLPFTSRKPYRRRGRRIRNLTWSRTWTWTQRFALPHRRREIPATPFEQRSSTKSATSPTTSPPTSSNTSSLNDHNPLTPSTSRSINPPSKSESDRSSTTSPSSSSLLTLSPSTRSSSTDLRFPSLSRCRRKSWTRRIWIPTEKKGAGPGTSSSTTIFV
ncbi:hypothetical protein BDY24DRAFT_52339 [Mrakia frigida]|uniref:uncharacterized protein n=1 Tax=Mrakia frigida TaxID=29902 RepID=UPI003FCBFFA1